MPTHRHMTAEQAAQTLDEIVSNIVHLMEKLPDFAFGVTMSGRLVLATIYERTPMAYDNGTVGITDQPRSVTRHATLKAAYVWVYKQAQEAYTIENAIMLTPNSQVFNDTIINEPAKA